MKAPNKILPSNMLVHLLKTWVLMWIPNPILDRDFGLELLLGEYLAIWQEAEVEQMGLEILVGEHSSITIPTTNPVPLLLHPLVELGQHLVLEEHLEDNLYRYLIYWPIYSQHQIILEMIMMKSALCFFIDYRYHFSFRDFLSHTI